MFNYKQAPSYPIWPFIVAVLILGVLATGLTNGFRAFYDYQRTTGANIPLNLDTLQFFTRESLHRQYLKLITPAVTEHSLPRFRLYSDEESIDKLNERLPMSGKQQVSSGHMVIENHPVTKANKFSSDVEFRYRGGLPMHWLYEKKSFRVRLPDFTSFNGEQSFNLVVPSTLHTVTDWISYDISRSLGILTPDFYPLEVLINNKSNGLHYFLSRIDESFLRKNSRMPGSIYSGDTLNIRDPFGSGKSRHEVTVLRPDGVSLLWNDARMWGKDSSRNAEREADRTDIQKFIAIVNSGDPVDFLENFETYFNRDVYFKFLALDSLLGNFHHDLYHNHKVYFDPYKGQFEPIEWDIRIWSNVRAKDIVEYRLLKQIIDNPLLELERDRVVYRLLAQYPKTEVEQMIRTAADTLEPVLATDPLRSAPVPFSYANSSQKSAPFSIQEYAMAIEELVQVYNFRHDMLSYILSISTNHFDIRKTGPGSVKLSITVDGNSPFSFDPYQLPGDRAGDKLRIFRSHKGTLYPIQKGALEILYPGRKTLPGNTLGFSQPWAIKTFGNSHSEFSPLHYEYIYENLNDFSMLAIDAINGHNAVTGEDIQSIRATTLASDEATVSVHPWDLNKFSNRRTSEIKLSGTIEVRQDRIYDKFQQVNIAPGTVISLCERCSIFFYGGVSALGTKEQPIVFRRMENNKAWGSIVIQGKGSNYSHLRHVVFDGGSLTTRNMIHYPGQFNIHDVDQFELDHCVLSNNSVGDDSLHIAYSKGSVSNCTFNNSAFDAVDIDISEVTVSDSEFLNSGNDGLDLMSSHTTVKNVRIRNAGDKCISVGEKSDVLVQNSWLSICNIGLAVKDGSSATLNRVNFEGYSYAGISLYQKNTRFGRGGTVMGNRISGLSMHDIRVNDSSRNLISADNLTAD